MTLYKLLEGDSDIPKGTYRGAKLTLHTAYRKFLKTELKLKKTIKVSILKTINSKTFGYVKLDDSNTTDYKIKVEDTSIVSILMDIAHEATHIKQIEKGELTFVDGDLYWKDKKIITQDKYNEVSYDDYKELPWEKEAILNSKILKDKFLKTTQELKGQTKTLDMIVDNLY